MDHNKSKKNQADAESLSRKDYAISQLNAFGPKERIILAEITTHMREIEVLIGGKEASIEEMDEMARSLRKEGMEYLGLLMTYKATYFSRESDEESAEK